MDVFRLGLPGETLRILMGGEFKKHGEYRTRRLVLEVWDRLGLKPSNSDGRYAVGDSIKKDSQECGGESSRDSANNEPRTVT